MNDMIGVGSLAVGSGSVGIVLMVHGAFLLMIGMSFDIAGVRRRLSNPRRLVIRVLKVMIWGYIAALILVGVATGAWIGFQMLLEAELIAIAWFAVAGYGVVVLLMLFVSYLAARPG